ncbi:hypothetical protein FRC06_001446 [Ceratobasidium sp. 370]|nr:hypothetical protein FRC06_001446 [Ceratobasidium sp. 370]
MEERSLLAAALRYGRACVRLMSGYNFRIWGDEWGSHTETVDGPVFSWDIIDTVCHAYSGFLELGEQNAGTTDTVAIAVSAVMPYCHWDFRWDAWNHFDKGQPRPALHTMQHIAESSSTLTDKARETLLSMLNQHFQEGGATLSPSALYLLVDSSAHYLVGRWPREECQGSHIQLLVLLARIALTSYNTAPDTAWAAAITLAAAAFACDTHPGGERSTTNDDAHNARKRRAVNVLKYYQIKKPNEAQVLALFIFGFFGLLPRFILNGYDTQLATMVPLLNRILQGSPSLLAKISAVRIRTMPEQFSLVNHAFKPLPKCLSSDADTWSDQITSESACLMPLLGLQIFSGDLRTYLIALIALCRAASEERRKQYMVVLDSQWIFYKPFGDLKSEDGGKLLEQLCRILLDDHSPIVSAAAPHFGLLVANIISSQDPLSDRQSALRPLLRFCDRFSGLKEPSPLKMSDLVSDIGDSITDGSTWTSLKRTMQSVVDFCGAGLSLNQDSGAESDSRASNVNWQSKFQELKSRYRFNLEDPEFRDTEGLGGRSPVPGATEESVTAFGIASGAVETPAALHDEVGVIS